MEPRKLFTKLSTLKTYGGKKRLRADIEIPSLKRQRVDEDNHHEQENQTPLLSEPSSLPSQRDDVLFTDDIGRSGTRTPSATPPSSPPEDAPNDSYVANTTTLEIKPAQRPGLKQTLVQTQINLGSSLQKTCKICRMTYVPSSAEDCALHRVHHRQCVDGIEVHTTMRKRLQATAVWRGSSGEFVAAVIHSDGTAVRAKAWQALRVVQAELGAVEISEEELWSHMSVDGQLMPRYKTYLFVKGGRCVGVCLAEVVGEAHRVVEFAGSEETLHSSSNKELAFERQSTSVRGGISRIWTSNAYRRQGVGSRLLDSVCASFVDDRALNKSEVAFSQPTELGHGLAKRWTGSEYGWHVYLDV